MQPYIHMEGPSDTAQIKMHTLERDSSRGRQYQRFDDQSSQIL